LYTYGLYVNCVAANIKGISKKEVTLQYNSLPIKCRSDIQLDGTEISELLCRKPGPYLKEIFKDLDEKTKELCAKLNNTLVIVVADHGHINCEYITLSEYKDIFNTLKQDISIEGRACAFFIKEGEHKNFEALFKKHFSKDFILYSKEEVINKNIFGIGKNHSRFEEALGDYLAIAISNKYFRYNENSIKYKSMHAGITEDEVLVPLIICKSNK